jgi:hypothetical protein
MKTIFLTVLVALCLVFFSASLIIAQENDSVVANDSESEPESIDSLEEIDDLNENDSVNAMGFGMMRARIWLTFNQEKKVQLELELARLRLIQAKIAAKNNNTIAMEKALEAHERVIQRVEERVAKIAARNLTEEKKTGLERAIQVHERRIEILKLLLANENLTDDERAKVEDRLTHVENVTDHLRDLGEVRSEEREQRQIERERRQNRNLSVLNESEDSEEIDDLNETE